MTLDESKAPICLFLRGGLGNQLLQFAYISHLSNASKRQHKLYYTLPPFEDIWSVIRQNTQRKVMLPVGPAAGFTRCCYPSLKSILRIISKVTCLRLLTDSGTATYHLAQLESHFTLPVFLGYFHRTECFSSLTKLFWLQIYQSFRSMYSYTPHKTGNIAMHIRLGDYLNSKNSKIYSLIPINDQVSRCLNSPLCDIRTSKIDIFTDNPAFVSHNLDRNYYPYVNIRPAKDPIEDLVTLASYRLIWGSNSTFSLCAGRISSLIYNTQTLVLPPRWFNSSPINDIEMKKWRSLDFVIGLPPI